MHYLISSGDRAREDCENLQRKYTALEEQLEHYKKQVSDNGALTFFKKMLLGPDNKQ